MATQTLILRPISATTAKGTPSHNKAATSVVPSDTSADAYHTLISEETADNDSTYVSIKGGYYIDVKFEALPQNLQVSNIQIMVTARTPSGTTDASALTYEFYKTVSGTSQVVESLTTDIDLVYLTDGYMQFTCESSLFTQELTAASDLDYTFRLQSPAVNIAISVTRIYAVVTYETLDSVSIYLHDNGAWNAVTCMIFQKVNGAWATVNSNVFVEGERFNLNLIE